MGPAGINDASVPGSTTNVNVDIQVDIPGRGRLYWLPAWSGCGGRVSGLARENSMISLTAEYALRAVVWLASRPDTAVGTRDIAKATQVPVGYMSKVLQALARETLVRSRPGRSGGFVLGRKPEAISVLDIVQAVDPIQRIKRCPLGHRQHNGELCPLHRRLDQAVAMVERAFAESSVAELVGEARSPEPLCTTADTAVARVETSRPKRGRRVRAASDQNSGGRAVAKSRRGSRTPLSGA